MNYLNSLKIPRKARRADYMRIRFDSRHVARELTQNRNMLCRDVVSPEDEKLVDAIAIARSSNTGYVSLSLPCREPNTPRRKVDRHYHVWPLLQTTEHVRH